MKGKGHMLFVAALLVAAAAAPARADLPPLTEDLRTYTLEIGPKLSEVLYDGIAFNKPERTEKVGAEGGHLKGYDRKIKTYDDGYATIVCKQRIYKFIHAACTVKFIAFRDQKAEDFLKLLSAEPVK